MSTRVTGTLQVSRGDRSLAALAAVALDPRRLAGWVRAGRAGALEANRLLVAANDAHVRQLRAALEKHCTESALTGADEALLAPPAPGVFGLDEALLSPIDELPLLADEPLPDALVEESLESESAVLLTAFSASLEAEGFVIDAIETSDNAMTITGRRGEQFASIRLGAGREITVDVDTPGFDDRVQCEAAHDALLGRLADVGLTVEPLGVRKQQLVADVESAVGRSLPGYEIRSIIEGDELQVIALPPTEHEGSSE